MGNEVHAWVLLPFHFWTVLFFVFGSMVGSFLNVCIHRMPLGQSVVTPPSHCPHCKYSIPWYLNMPLFTWLILKGKCRNCAAPISIRYFLVELLTGAAFVASWTVFGSQSHPLTTVPLALAYSTLLAGFIAATCIDIEHLIIPDEITIGGIGAGFLFSLALPALHGAVDRRGSATASFWGIVVGGGLIYAVVRLGKLMFGKQRITVAAGSRIIFEETGLVLPDRQVPYDEIFYRDSDVIVVQAEKIEMPDRCYWSRELRLEAKKLTIGDEVFEPETISRMEVVADSLILPREAMGFGDVKFMAAIGAFLGWQGALFSLMFSSALGSTVGLGAIALKRKDWSGKIPYGPYIAAAAVCWVFMPSFIKGPVLEHMAVFSPSFWRR